MRVDDRFRQQYLDDAVARFRAVKRQADKSLEQVSDEEFFQRIDAEANSLAQIVKHVSGNLRSRWTDFLTSDGEKPERRRDTEFEIGEAEARAALTERWEQGWRLLFESLAALTPADLDRQITIRGEPHTIVEALSRQLSHQSAHIGQITFLAKHLRGAGWRTLSIPRGKSEEFNAEKRRKAQTDLR